MNLPNSEEPAGSGHDGGGYEHLAVAGLGWLSDKDVRRDRAVLPILAIGRFLLVLRVLQGNAPCYVYVGQRAFLWQRGLCQHRCSSCQYRALCLPCVPHILPGIAV